MFRKTFTTLLVASFLGIAVHSNGCDKSVQQFCHNLSKCSDEVSEEFAMRKGVPKDQVAVVKKMIKKQFGDEAACKKRFKGKTIKKNGRKCVQKKSCKEFAKCFADIATKAEKK